MIRTQYLSPPPQIHSPSPPLKRKRDLSEDDDDSYLLPLDERPPPSKRAHSLEDGFSLMSLTSSPVGLQPTRPPWSPEHVTLQTEEDPFSPINGGHEVLSSPIVEMYEGSSEGNPTVVSGDTGDEPHDIDMKRSTWYEKDKDRIVILDLDSDDEDTPASSPPREYTISSALLSRLPVPVLEGQPPAPPPGQLILYRPPPWKDLDEVDVRSRNVDEQDVYPMQEAPDFNGEAMEIEDV